MKKILVSLIATVMFSITGVDAQNKEMYTSEIQTEQDVRKECIFVDSKTKSLLQKNTYVFDNAGLPIQKIVYKWEGKKGWQEVIQYSYNYIGSQLVFINYNEWNKDTKTWNKIQQIEHFNANLFLANNK